MNVLVDDDDPFVFDAELFHQPAAVAVFLIYQDVDFGQDTIALRVISSGFPIGMEMI